MKNVLITGGSSGLGKELVKCFNENGYNVYFTYFKNKPQNLENSYYCDLSNEEDINKLLDKLPNIDILINNSSVEFDTDFYLKNKKDS